MAAGRVVGVFALLVGCLVVGSATGPRRQAGRPEVFVEVTRVVESSFGMSKLNPQGLFKGSSMALTGCQRWGTSSIKASSGRLLNGQTKPLISRHRFLPSWCSVQ
jgi:hypothetical protein